MSEFMNIFKSDETKHVDMVSIGSIKLNIRNYLYLSMLRTWLKDDNVDYNQLIDAIIKNFIDTHQDEIKELT